MTQFLAFVPEFLLLALGALILGSEVVRASPGGGEWKGTWHLAWTGLAAVLIAQVALPDGAGNAVLGGAVFGGYGTDRQIDLWKQVFTAAALGTVLLSRSYFLPGGSSRGLLTRAGALHGLLVLCTFGMFALVSARDLLVFYLGLELATLPLYALAAFQPRDGASAEAGSKYVLFGGLSSALILFGISFLYGAAGGLGLDALRAAAEAEATNPVLLAGVFFVTGGLGFKLAMAPFHMWAPDIYEGAPTPVMAFLSVGSKAAAVGALALLFFGPLDPLRGRMAMVFASAAVLSMVLGNLGAMRQTNLRRFVAYSSIAQVGYMLVAMVGDAAAARTALLYNLVVYGVSGFALYFVMSVIGRDRQENLFSLRGLSRQSPGLALLLALAMFSLAGIPPLAGFLGKFLLFAAAAERGHYLLVGIAVVNAAVSFYYYMQPVKQAYIADSGPGLSPLDITAGRKAALWALGVLLLALGLLPALLRYFSLA
jgi:NADH-quinone oxidoreductase subunit N